VILVPQALTAAAFAPYGDVIAAETGAGAPINEGSTRRAEAVAALDLQREQGRAALAVYQASARHFPFRAVQIECHRLSDQVFLPLGAALRCVQLVAVSDARGAPGPLQAFVTDGRQGIRLRAGTWHHGLLSLDDGPWAVLERRALDRRVDCALHDLAPAVTLRLG
jgi:ureidoglycolate lyase